MIGVRSGIDEYGSHRKFVVSGYVGEFKYFGFATVPEHCLVCDGSEVSRETYSELFAVFGTTFGAGDGTTTFNLPDFRGAFLRCTGGNAAALGVEQGDAIRNITGSFSLNGVAGNSPISYPPNDIGAFDSAAYSASYINAALTGDRSAGNSKIFDASRVVPVADENRPINYAVNVCVVYE